MLQFVPDVAPMLLRHAQVKQMTTEVIAKVVYYVTKLMQTVSTRLSTFKFEGFCPLVRTTGFTDFGIATCLKG